MSPKTKESIEKVAYTAVGAPIAAVKAVGARISDLREAVRGSRSDLSDDLAREFENWAAEGERVVNQALERLRETGAVEQARSTTQSMRERVEASIEELGDALDVVEPEESLQLIRGIGPGSADRLEEAGVTGIASFLHHTSSTESMARLAEESGFSPEMVEQWRRQADLSRIDGVGDGYMRLLHRAGIWTMDQLGGSSPATLMSKLEGVDMTGMPSQMPSEERLAEWIDEAKKLRDQA